MKLASPGARRAARAVAASAAIALLAGCASAPMNPRDPLEPFNRKMTEFNEGLDSMLLKPTAQVYRSSVPPLVRTGVANFFSNLGDAWTFVNSALQLRPVEAQESLARFQINTFIGVFGIFDVASEFNIERHKEDFGQTLGRWGVPPGPYVVLPFFGPSTLRDTFALPVDRKFDLVRSVQETGVRNTLYGLRAVDARANLLRVGNVIEEAALDRYSFTRDAYLQKRRAEIYDFKQTDNDGAEPKDGEVPPVPAAPASAPGQPASAPAR